MAETKGLRPSDSMPPDPESTSPDAAAIETWLISNLAEMLRVNPASIDVRRPFTYLGLNSADGVILAGDLERWLGGRRLSPTLAWDFPTIEALSRHLATGDSAGNQPLGAVQPRGDTDAEYLLSEIENLPEEQPPLSSASAPVREES
jgi:acyl carrier protein